VGLVADGDRRHGPGGNEVGDGEAAMKFGPAAQDVPLES
jgi:hypothetical protein